MSSSAEKSPRERHLPKDSFDKADDDDPEQKVPACAQLHLSTLISACMVGTRTEGAAACRSCGCRGTETREITARSIQTAPAVECEGSCAWLCLRMFGCAGDLQSHLSGRCSQHIYLHTTPKCPNRYHCRWYHLKPTLLCVCGYRPRNMEETRCAGPTGTRTDS